MEVELEVVSKVGDATTTRRIRIEDPSDLVIERLIGRLLEVVHDG